MDRKTFTLILAVVLIGAFFLAYYNYFLSVSGYDIVFSTGGDDWQRFILLLTPICGVLLLVGALNNGNYILGRGLLSWLPLLAVLYWILIGPIVNGMDVGDVFKSIGKLYGIGLWLTIGDRKSVV